MDPAQLEMEKKPAQTPGKSKIAPGSPVVVKKIKLF